MVNTRSQKRRGMLKRATRKNLKNRHAQTKRRGQQKGGENPPPKPPRTSRNKGLNVIKLDLNSDAFGNLVFDFDKTLTEAHSGGYPMTKWVNGNRITDAFNGQLEDLKKILSTLKDAGYNLFLNSRGSRSQLIDFFYTTNLINLIPENNIFGASDDKTRVLSINENEPANSYAEIGIGGSGDTKNWARQKLRYLRRILQDTNNLPTNFYDDTEENIKVVKQSGINNLEGIHITPAGLPTTLRKLDLSTTYILLKKSHINDKGKNTKSENRYFNLELPDKLHYYDEKINLKGTIPLDKIINFEESYEGWFSFKFEVGKSGRFGTKSTTTKHFKLEKTDNTDNDDFLILKQFIKGKAEENQKRNSPLVGGGKKSESKSKTRTQKRRSTNPKNKRTRKSKK